MLTVPEAAIRAKRDPETVRRWIRAGKLAARKVGTQHVIDEEDLAAFIRTPSDTVPLAPEWKRGRAERGSEIHEAVAPYVASPESNRPLPPVGIDLFLPHIVGRIVHAMDPVRIILFGSRARGDARDDSDYDLLVVMDQLTDRRATRIAIRRSYDRLPIASDVVVATPDEIDGSIPGRPTGVVYWALQEGRVVYDREDDI